MQAENITKVLSLSFYQHYSRKFTEFNEYNVLPFSIAKRGERGKAGGGPLSKIKRNH